MTGVDWYDCRDNMTMTKMDPTLCTHLGLNQPISLASIYSVCLFAARSIHMPQYLFRFIRFRHGLVRIFEKKRKKTAQPSRKI